MSPSQLPHTELTHQQFEIFRILYPIFKEEVFSRREQMIRLTAFSSTVLVVILFTQATIIPWLAPDPFTPWLFTAGIILFSGVFTFFILQHAKRHRMAKQQLITLEQTLGLYHDKGEINGDALFPHNWQYDWTTDQSVTIYLAALSILTMLVIIAVLIQT